MCLVFQVVLEESKNGPLIILLKDIEKSMTGSSDSYVTLKSKLELLPPGVLIVGSHTQMDSRKEKVILLSDDIYMHIPAKLSIYIHILGIEFSSLSLKNISTHTHTHRSLPL